ncbi:MAG TPA: DnaJ domain-containing protein [Ktedonobacterales bacterium]
MAEERDHYAVLGVASEANEEQIRLAFRRQARLYHPDVAGTGDLARMLALNEAYRVLSDPELRRQYDRTRGLPGIRSRSEPSAGASAAPSATASAAPHSGPRASASPAPAAGSLRTSSGPLRQRARLAASDRTALASVSFARGGALLATGLIDGQVQLWDVATQAITQRLSFAAAASAGVLREVRLSPAGTLAAAWGLALGTRVWNVADGRTLWSSGANAPSGAMDLALTDQPALARLALPDAPLALAGEDPFRWAHEGRAGTAVFTRPLAGPVDPAWAVPRQCVEGRASDSTSNGGNGGWRVHERLLSADGQHLLTFSAQPGPGKVRTMALHIWEIEGRAPRRVARVALAPGAAWYPLAATPDLAWVAIGYQEQTVRVLAPATQAQRTISTGLLPPESRVALAPDAALLALARGKTLDLWAVADGTLVQHWDFAAEVTALAFAARVAPEGPAGTAGWPALAIGLSNGVAEVWG